MLNTREILSKEIKELDFLELVEDLALSLESGMTVFEGLELIEKGRSNPLLESKCIEFREFLEEGDSISKAWDKVFPNAGHKASSLIRIYEKNGKPSKGLRLLAEDLREKMAYKKEMKKTLYYPLLVSFLAFLALIWFLNFFLPSILKLSADLLTSEEFLKTEKNFWRFRFSVNFFAFFGSFFVLYLIFAKEGRKKIISWLSDKKLFADFFNIFLLTSFAESFSFLLKNGFPLMQSLEMLAEDASFNISEADTESCKELIGRGYPLSKGLEAYSFFGPRELAIIRKGEKRGSLPQSFDLIYEYSNAKKRKFLKDFFIYFEPLVILFAGLLTGFLVYSFYKLIFSVTLNIV